MTAAWMLYALCVGAMITVAAHAAEHAVRALRRPTRAAWLLAMATTLAAPLVAAALASGAGGPTTAAGVVVLPAAVIVAVGESMARAGSWLAPLGALAGAAWIASSSLAALLLARALLLLHRRRRGWAVHRVRGTTLLVAPDTGPAVVGVRRMQVVLPEWALALDDRLLAMMLRHEAEHVAARDPRLLLTAAVALVLTPWNLALWWQARRLRLAIEVDCDARVLRVHDDVERYGLLLLAVAQRRQLPTSMFSPALLEPVSLLERRIAAMTARPTRRPWIVAGLGGTLAAVALFVACSAPAPNESEPAGPRSAAPLRSGDRGAQRSRLPTQHAAGDAYFEFQVEKAVVIATNNAHPRYPATLKAARVEGEVQAQFVVDTTGVPIPGTFKVLRSQHELFTEAVREALPRMRFVPAEIGGRKVRQLVQQPYQFALSR